MSAEDQIIATGSRAEVADGDDPRHAPVTVAFAIGDQTTLTFVTTPAAIEGPDGEAIEVLLENTSDFVVRTFEALANELEAQEADRG